MAEAATRERPTLERAKAHTFLPDPLRSRTGQSIVALSKAPGLIGPNAILQLKQPMDAALGAGAMDLLLTLSNVKLPTGDCMVDQRDVAAVHQTLAITFPDFAPGIAASAGKKTAHYICANRIPAPARTVLRVVPTAVGVQMLTKAIAKHAWTFCGTGSLTTCVRSTIRFEIKDNPVVEGMTSDAPCCHWHAAVFGELYTKLLGKPFKTKEVACRAMGASACTFEVSRAKLLERFTI
ncbi:MAG: bacteriochlorophyll 4-vinyl reductase [Pseudomonadota bacterium]